ncbi:hypothetical protein [Rhizobacter sp. OV335]|uniref:hypothetical protein n=1 Tax=Rhizobacter sp. OV335 TaxID=1500264 RepID=UPI00091FD7A4|nr:hypothetical protein [Rhizobacter sp. OV335]SHM54036.1 hypothetical protein SAMN02787076_01554 [Rhizobacter sp. OV335]
MEERKFNVRDFIGVRQVEPIKESWPIRCPFDLIFSRQRLTEVQNSAISGSGIYLIEKLPQREVVYLGLYKPMAGDIIPQRWGRHLQTITWRGANIGLGPNCRDRTPAAVTRRMESLLAVTIQPELKAIIRAAYAQDCADTVRHCKSTGNDTSLNRLRFADEHWDEFSRATPQTLLDSFSFHLLRMRPALDQKSAATEVARIEKRLLSAWKLVCNGNYKHPSDQPLRRQNAVPALVDAVSKAMNSVTGTGALQWVSLRP